MEKEKAESQKRQYYKQIAERSFATVFDQYLFYCFSRDYQGKINCDNFKTFVVTQNIIDEYVNEYWQQSYKYKKQGIWEFDIKQIETLIYKWKKVNLETLHLAAEDYVSNKFFDIYPYEKFIQLLETKTCYYCGISEDMIAQLVSKRKIFKKKITRGWTLEIDRKKPNLEYTEENCVRCCYWCNSAKTDEFDEIEFKPIGEAIKQIWNERLSC